MSRQRVFNKMLAEIPWDGAELASPLSIGGLSATSLTVSGPLTLPNGSITSLMLAADSVTSAKIAPNTIVAADMAAGAAAGNVGTLGGVLGGTLPNPSMAAGAAATNVGSLSGVLTGTLPAPGMAAGAAATNVGTVGGVLTGTLPNPGMAADAVGTTQIQNGAVTAGKLAPGAGLVDPLTLENGLTVNAPAAIESLTVLSKAVDASPDAGNSLAWNINGFYVPQVVERFTAAYYYVANTTMVNPGPGNFRTNTTGTPGAVTQVAINNLDDTGRDMSVVIRSMQVGDQIRAQVEDDASQWSRVTLTELPTDMTGWWLLDVEDAGYENAVAGGEATWVTFLIGGGGGGGSGEQAAHTEEYLPAAAATTVTLTREPAYLLVVTRDGIAQSMVDGHYSIATDTLTFSEAFTGTERVLVTYAVGAIGAIGPVGPQGEQGIQGIQGIQGPTGPLGPSANVHEEFMPANLATVITLSQACQAVLLVSRNGVVQSQTSGNYSIAGSVLTFTDAFNGSERVVVEYAQQIASPAPPFNGSGIVDGSITSPKLAAGLSLTGGLGVTGNVVTDAVTLSKPHASMSQILSSTGNSAYVAPGAAHVGANAYYAADNNWYRTNPATPAMLVVFLQGSVLYYYAAAGANPISWTKAGVRLCADDVDTSWQTPTFKNSYTNYSAPFVCGYRKMPDGTVMLRGIMLAGTQSTAAFTLPTGYRPSQTILAGTPMQTGIVRVDVSNNGDVAPGEVKAGTWTAGGWIAVEGIRFLAEA